MTLVITEVSEKFGCIVVGDSAVTIGKKVVNGAEKVHYSSQANIGFAIWGNACLAGKRVDELLSRFADDLDDSYTPRSAGRELTNLLIREAAFDGRDWASLRGGVHICGYEGAVPVLFHVHTGAEPPAEQVPYSLHEDYPNASALCQLRNGYYKMFSGLYEGMERYTSNLVELGFDWPYKNAEDRVSYYSIMVDTVSKTLAAAGRQASVGGLVSALAFNRDGIQVDKRIRRGTEGFCAPNTAYSASFSEPSTEFRQSIKL